MTQPLFQSFFQGGFECSTHRRGDRRRLDVLAGSGHDVRAGEDYRLLRRLGMRTVRDGLRWHRIERMPYHYDWSSFLPMLHAARESSTQVIWDLMHYGWPDGLDIWSRDFVARFAHFAGAAARVIFEETGQAPWVVPVNEISFHAWAGGEVGYLNPHATKRGPALKRQLAQAAIAAIEAVRMVDTRARIIMAEPLIHVLAPPLNPAGVVAARVHNEAQFEAFDMIAGRLAPELGGQEDYLDIIGLNYYPYNQWVHGGGAVNWRNDPRYVPLHVLLKRHHDRYGRPLFIAETGIEGDVRPAWLARIGREVRAAIANGVPVHGICLYPVLNHPGWDDDRHCPNGLIDYDPASGRRFLYRPLAHEIKRQQTLFGTRSILSSLSAPAA